MSTLNKSQSHLVKYIDKYRSLLREIGDSITDYREGCGFGRVLKSDGTEPSFQLSTVTQEDQDWLVFQFYALLKYDLCNHVPDEQVKDILETIDRADTILSALHNKDGYSKYHDREAVSQDSKILMDAFIETEKILDAIIPGRTGKTESLSHESPEAERVERSKITSKQVIATALGLTSVYKLNKLCEAKVYELYPVPGERQSWQIRIDKLDESVQKKLRP